MFRVGRPNGGHKAQTGSFTAPRSPTLHVMCRNCPVRHPLGVRNRVAARPVMYMKCEVARRSRRAVRPDRLTTRRRTAARVKRRPAGAAGLSGATNAGGQSARWDELLDLDLGALLFEGGFDLVRLVLGDAFLDRLGMRVDQVLGFLEAEAGQLAHDLDDRDLVRADLGQHRAELGLLLGRGGGGRATGSGAGRRRGSNRDGGSGGHAVVLLVLLDELGQLEEHYGVTA